MDDRFVAGPLREATVSEWLPQAPSIEGLSGAGELLLLATLLHFALRGLDRFGLINYGGAKFRRGLGTAAVALNAIFQPHARAPDNNCDRILRKQSQVGDGDEDRTPSPAAMDTHTLPDDGLRTSKNRLGACEAHPQRGKVHSPGLRSHGPAPDTNRRDPQPHQ